MMRWLVLKMSMSVDGFLAGPNGEVDWMIRSRDEGGKAWVADTLRHAGLHAMGSRTYYAMAGYWPTATDLLAAPMNNIPKIVLHGNGRWTWPRGTPRPHCATRGRTSTESRRRRRLRARQAGPKRRSPMAIW